MLLPGFFSHSAALSVSGFGEPISGDAEARTRRGLQPRPVGDSDVAATIIDQLALLQRARRLSYTNTTRAQQIAEKFMR